MFCCFSSLAPSSLALLSCLVLSCLVLSCLVLSCLVLSCLTTCGVRVRVRVRVRKQDNDLVQKVNQEQIPEIGQHVACQTGEVGAFRVRVEVLLSSLGFRVREV